MEPSAPMTHELTIERVYTSGNTPHGAIPLLSGYVGVCSCGKRSPLYGVTAPLYLWHEQHVDPTGRKARAIRKGVR